MDEYEFEDCRSTALAAIVDLQHQKGCPSDLASRVISYIFHLEEMIQELRRELDGCVDFEHHRAEIVKRDGVVEMLTKSLREQLKLTPETSEAGEAE